MNAIAAVDDKWAIGCNNKLLIRIPEDTAYFKKMTLGKTIIMGRRTFDSFPGSKALAGRVNIVLSENEGLRLEGATVYNSLDALTDGLKPNWEELMVIGGESIYRQLLPYCAMAYITKIYHSFNADSFFPNLDTNSQWELVNQSEKTVYKDIEYQFLEYRNLDVKAPGKG